MFWKKILALSFVFAMSGTLLAFQTKVSTDIAEQNPNLNKAQQELAALRD